MASDKERAGGSASAEIGKYLDILAKDPNSRVFAPLAEAYRKAGFLDDAVETALEGLKVHPNYLGGRVALGRAYFEKKQYAEAAAEMQKVVKSAPDNIVAHKVLGQIAQSQHDLQAAEKAFKMVLLLDPRDQEAQQFIANLGGGAPAAPKPALPYQAAPPIESPSADFGSIAIDEIQPLDDLPLAELEIVAKIATSPPPGEPEQLIPPPPAAELPDSAAGATMEVEIFAQQPAVVELPQPAAASPAEEVGAPEESPPFEVLGRQKGGATLETAKEEQPFGEIEIDLSAQAPIESEPEPGDESPFEIFTREPAYRITTAPAKAGREGAGPREVEIETTAYSPSETFLPDAAEAPVVSLDEELPRIDLAQELEFEPTIPTEPSPAEPDRLSDLRGGPTAQPEPVDLFGEEDEVLPAQEQSPEERFEQESFQEESFQEESFQEESFQEESPAAEPAGRGVFDTETLASIYINQGFYGRATEIYQRLIADRPEDEGLRRKLERIQALERGEGGAGPAGAAGASIPVVPEQAATVSVTTAPEDERIVRLQVLLEAFKGGRPR